MKAIAYFLKERNEFGDDIFGDFHERSGRDVTECKQQETQTPRADELRHVHCPTKGGQANQKLV